MVRPAGRAGRLVGRLRRVGGGRALEGGCWREGGAMDSFDLLSDLMWLPVIWFVVLAWDWSSQQSCQFLARFASPHRRREWGYQ